MTLKVALSNNTKGSGTQNKVHHFQICRRFTDLLWNLCTNLREVYVEKLEFGANERQIFLFQKIIGINIEEKKKKTFSSQNTLPTFLRVSLVEDDCLPTRNMYITLFDEHRITL